MNHLRRTFELFDGGGSGVIDREVFATKLMRLTNATDGEVETTLDKYVGALEQVES